MSTHPANGACDPGVKEILADLLTDDLLALKTDERLWKLYCFRSPDHPTVLRHRIYTKQKPDGRLALVTFAAHNPIGQGNRRTPVRSGIARVPDLTAEDLDRIITAVRNQVRATESDCEELDLSGHNTLQQQVAWLQANA